MLSVRDNYNKLRYFVGYTGFICTLYIFTPIHNIRMVRRVRLRTIRFHNIGVHNPRILRSVSLEQRELLAQGRQTSSS